MSLHHSIWGRGRRLVLAHGFTQNAQCWGPFGHDLAADHEVVAVDLPGHGRTPPGHDEADLVAAGRLLGEAGGAGVYIGYSMGGRVALHTALEHPGQVEGLVLIGVTAGIDDGDARHARREADGLLAEQVVDQGLPGFLDQWLANPLFAGLPARAACIPQRLGNRPVGLAASLRCRGTGTQQPLWSRLEELDLPVLVLVGDDDAKFTELGRRLVQSLARAELASLPATHAVHLECPTSAAEAVRNFVDRLG